MAGEYRRSKPGKQAATMAVRHTSPRPPDIELPERYRLLRHIADGGMASVWCALDDVLSRKVAIKIVAAQFRHDPAALRRFGREARAAARVSGHRHIVTIYDSGPAFIVMEHLTGGTVSDALRSGDVSAQTAARWIGEAAAALDYAHDHGVVHGDIKPANMLLDSSRVVHVADFGLARLATEDTITSTGQLFGTAAYLAPEQALGARATGASDRYALGVVAFELLTGEKPFKAGGLIKTANSHVNEEPPPASLRNPALPPTLDAVLERAMAKRPEDRWSSAGAFAAAIDASLANRGIAFVPAGAKLRRAPISAPRRRISRPRAGALAALAAVALLAGIAIAAIPGGSSSHPRLTAQNARHAASAAKPAPKPISKPQAAKAKPAGTPTTSTPTSTPPPSPSTAAILEAQGHSMMLAGQYSAAIPVLQQAVHSAQPGSLLYQWSLFDLGHSYREEGDLVAAIPLLQERLRYADAKPIVQQELNAALSMYRAGAPEQPADAAGQPANPKAPGASHRHGAPSVG
jgi:serine/threonine protein kinase